MTNYPAAGDTWDSLLASSEHKEFIAFGRQQFAGYMLTPAGAVVFILADRRAGECAVILNGEPWEWVSAENAAISPESFREHRAEIATGLAHSLRGEVRVYADMAAYLAGEVTAV